MSSGVPTRTFTFLFTDIEGSTQLWEQSPAKMSVSLSRHDSLLREAIESNGGRVFKTVGDAFCAAFADPSNAVAAALAAQRAILTEQWPEHSALTVRMALHTGGAEVRGDDYYGPVLNRVARLLAIGNGNQVLLSGTTEAAVRATLPMEATLLDRGSHRLKDLQQPERVFQLCHPALPAQLPPLRSLSSHPNNLPRQLTSFIGREKEIAEVMGALGRARLLTVTGSGGCGKTRLALQVAADSLESFPDGVWIVELAALTDPGLVPYAVAAALGLKEEPGKNPMQTLTEYIKSRHLLLLLDNAEHLLAACAQLADEILRRCAQVALLVTSREGLAIGGELTYRVPSLSVPDPQRDTTPERLTHYESVRLFIERARLQRPQFVATSQNASALASICHRLDGIPLALELAAARMRSLSVEEVNQRLDQQFRLLTGGSRTALPRQQTLRSLIDWSYDLLGEGEQSLLRRVSVFSGGWTLEAAQRVCVADDDDEWAALELLTSLVDKSLVLAEERNGATRYRLLETVRQYARQRLSESGDATRWRDRHLTYLVAVAEEAEPHLSATDQQVWLDRLETEHDNIRSALGWCSSVGGDAGGGLRLAGALWRFWYGRGYFGEGRGWLSQLLAVVPAGQVAAGVRAKALHGTGALARLQGDYRSAKALFEETLAIRRELGDRRGAAGALGNLGNLASDQGDYVAARALYEESMAICRELGLRESVGTSLNNLGIVAHAQGDYSAARKLYEEGLVIARESGDRRGIAYVLSNLGNVVGDQGDLSGSQGLHEQSLGIRRELNDKRGIASSLGNLANVLSDQGNHPAARALYEESMAISQALGDRRGIAVALEGLGCVAFAMEGPSRAARIWGVAERLREELGTPLPRSEQSRHDRQVAEARTASGAGAAFDLAWQEGRAVPPERAMAYALNTAV